MPISNFPAVLQPIIQANYLERRFEQALRSKLRYRQAAERMPFNTGIGESLTKTRAGLLATVTTPMNPAASGPTSPLQTNLDNGLTPAQWAVEQYTIGINRYANTLNLNTVTSGVAIANRFVQNAVALGENAARSLEELARNYLYAGYLGGNTRVRVASNTTSVSVDDIRGFTTVAVIGVQQPVSGTYPMTVTIGASVYSVVGVAADVTNVSVAPQGISGVLTLAAAVSATDGAVNSPVIASTAAVIVRPNGRTNTSALASTDLLTMASLLDAKAQLDRNGVPRIDGFFNVYVDPISVRQLFADPDFKQLFQGATSETQAFKTGSIESAFLGLRFLDTTEAPIQPHPTIAGLSVHRPIICGAGALLEGDFVGQDNTATPNSVDLLTSVADGVTMVTREPLDRLAQDIAQSWYWIGGFCCPTDITTNPQTIPTATNAAFKRAVVIEHVGQ